MNAGVGIPLTVLLLLLNGFFVAAEFALVSARRAGIEPLADAGSRRARVTLRSMERVSTMMAGAQLGITLCSLALGAVSEPVIAHLLEPAFDAVGLPAGVLHPAAFAVAILLITVLHVVLGEMVPKNIALAGPERAALVLAPLLAAIVTGLRPVISGLNHLANAVLRLARVQPRDEVVSAFTRDEVAGMVEQSHRDGLLRRADRDLLGGVLAFDSATAADVVLPLARVHALGPRPTVDDVERLAAHTGVTRFPIRDGDRFTGYIHVKDTLAIAAEARTRPLPAAALRELPDVAADLPLGRAIEVMRTARAHMGRVVSDGDTLGVITLDDILLNLIHPTHAETPAADRPAG